MYNGKFVTSHKGKPINVFYFIVPMNGWNQITINGNLKITIFGKKATVVPIHDILAFSIERNSKHPCSFVAG